VQVQRILLTNSLRATEHDIRGNVVSGISLWRRADDAILNPQFKGLKGGQHTITHRHVQDTWE